MMSDFYLGAYWGSRKESARQCSERLTRFLQYLSSTSEGFATWYEKGNAGDAKMCPVAPTPEQIINLLDAGRNRRDFDNSVIEDLGFHVGLWNGMHDERAASLNITCGLYTKAALLKNVVVLDFPEQLGDLAQAQRALSVLLAVIKAWEPEWAGVMSRTSTDLRPFTPGLPFLDWMLYLNCADIDSSQLPSSASVIRVDRGDIVITQNHPVDPNNQVDVQNIRSVEAAILQWL